MKGYFKFGDLRSDNGTIFQSLCRNQIVPIPEGITPPAQTPQSFAMSGTPTDDSFSLSWTNPTYDPPATGLRIKRICNRGAEVIATYIDLDPDDTSYEDIDLANPLDEGYPYTYYICAFNEGGEGNYSSGVLNGAPTNTVSNLSSGWQGEGSLGISWDLPGGGFTPYATDIIIEARRTDFAGAYQYKVYALSNYDGSTISDLDVATSYDFRIAGRNRRGIGTYSASLTAATTAGTMPGGAYSILKQFAIALTQPNEVTLNWSADDPDASATIQVQRNVNSGGWSDVAESPLPAGTEIYVDDALSVGSVYQYRIRLTGETAWSMVLTKTALAAATNPNFAKTPWLLYPNDPAKMRIMFQTDIRKTGYTFYVEWGTTLAYGNSSGNLTPGAGNVCTYLISGLNPATKIYYRVHCGSNTYASYFYSAPAVNTGTTQTGLIYSIGDTQENPEIWEKIAELILTDIGSSTLPVLLLHDGDRVYDGSEAVWDEIFFNPSTGNTNIKALLGRAPIAGCAHGHDEYPDTNRDNFNRYFPVETLPIEYYSLRWGNVEAFFLQELTGYELFDPQWAWLDAALSASNASYKIMMVHAPFYAAGDHENDTSMYPLLSEVINDYNLNLIYQGHNHNFALCKVDGVYFATVGSSGATIYTQFDPSVVPYFVDGFEDHCWSKLVCSGSNMILTIHQTTFNEAASPKTFISDSVYNSYSIPRIKSAYTGLQAPSNLNDVSVTATAAILSFDILADIDDNPDEFIVEASEFMTEWQSYIEVGSAVREWPYTNWVGDAIGQLITASGLNPETNYRLRVRAKKGTTYSSYSSVLEITTGSINPSVPTGAQYDNASYYYSYASERVDIWIDWTNPAESDKIEIEKSLNGTDWTALAETEGVATYRDQFYVSAGNEANISDFYYYRIRAYNEVDSVRYYSDWVELGAFNAQPIPNTDPTIEDDYWTGWVGFTWTLIETGSPDTPWEDQQVERRMDGGAWSVIEANVGKWEGGYSDESGLSSGHNYQYRMCKTSRFGQSSYITSAVINL